MKKLLSGIFFLMSLGLCLTACSDDEEDNNAYSTTCPEIETAGTYTGTWTREEDGGGTTTATGTLTFEAGESYVTTVTAKCDDINVDYQSVANIVFAGNRYAYSNMRANNGFGAVFSGEITTDNVASISFTLTVKEGRKSYVYYYSFEGTKQ